MYHCINSEDSSDWNSFSTANTPEREGEFYVLVNDLSWVWDLWGLPVGGARLLWQEALPRSGSGWLTGLHRWGQDENCIFCSIYCHCLSKLVFSNLTPIHLYYLFCARPCLQFAKQQWMNTQGKTHILPSISYAGEQNSKIRGGERNS